LARHVRAGAPGAGQAECHTERSDGARTYVVSDLD
jgi:hypothetical protein